MSEVERYIEELLDVPAPVPVPFEAVANEPAPRGAVESDANGAGVEDRSAAPVLPAGSQAVVVPATAVRAAVMSDTGPRVWPEPVRELVVVTVAGCRVAASASEFRDLTELGELVPGTGAATSGRTAIGGLAVDVVAGAAVLLPPDMIARRASAGGGDRFAVRIGDSAWAVTVEAVSPLGPVSRADVKWRRRRDVDQAVVGLVGEDRLPLVDGEVLVTLLEATRTNH